MKANVKKEAGKEHPDRDKQFSYIEAQRQALQAAGWSIISVHANKEELIGNFKNAGQAWCPGPEYVNVHDFPQDALGRALPYGIHDMTHNCGCVYVGASADTPHFAADAIVTWWQNQGQAAFPQAGRLSILADAGGSNGYRPRAWKPQLQEQLSAHLGMAVSVYHYPAGCSKWNPIERRQFSHISINWAGKPLCTFDLLLAYIPGTTTTTGLTTKALMLEGVHETGQRVSNAEMEKPNLERHAVCPNWIYTIRPRSDAAPDT